jgi:hypothetical protein
MSLFVLHANAWAGYLVCHLFPQAAVIPWRADLAAEDVADSMGRHASGTSADAALLFHVDLSDTRRTPRERPQLMGWLRSRGIAGLNAGCDDLSRRRLQQRLRALSLNTVAIDPRPADDTRVIVKTDPNHGGEAELRLSPQERAMLGVSFEGAWFAHSREYRVLPLRDVPPEVLAHPDYAVERYVDDGSGVFFRVYVSGTAVLVVKAHCDQQIKAVRGDARDENWGFRLDELDDLADAAIPSKLARAIRTFVLAEDLHFGSIDIVPDERGEPHVVDLNTTPWGGKVPIDEEIAEFLREGFVQGAELRSERMRRGLPPCAAPHTSKE